MQQEPMTIVDVIQHELLKLANKKLEQEILQQLNEENFKKGDKKAMDDELFLGAKGLTPYDALNIFDTYIQKGWRIEYGIVDQADNGFWDRENDRKLDVSGNPFQSRYTYETFVYPPDWGDWLNKYHIASEYLPELLCELAYKLKGQGFYEYSRKNEVDHDEE